MTDYEKESENNMNNWRLGKMKYIQSKIKYAVLVSFFFAQSGVAEVSTSPGKYGLLVKNPADLDLDLDEEWNTAIQKAQSWPNFEEEQKNNFWYHKYYDLIRQGNFGDDNTHTHTGYDFKTVRLSPPFNNEFDWIYSMGYGRVEARAIGGVKTISVRHLITEGEYLYFSYLHMKDRPEIVKEGNYIAKFQHLGTEYNSGLGRDDEKGKHLHIEASNTKKLEVVLSDAACNDELYDDVRSVGYYKYIDLIKLKNENEGKDDNHKKDKNDKCKEIDEGRKKFYDPMVIADKKEEALPYLSKSVPVSNGNYHSLYDVYGVENQPIYSYARITADNHETGVYMQKTGLRSEYRELTVDSGPLSTGSIEQLSATNNSLAAGDYLLSVITRPTNGSDDAYREGYPLLFSIVKENEVIVDNDQRAIEGDKEGTEFSATGELAISEDKSLGRIKTVPGYYLSAVLAPGNVHDTSSGDVPEASLSTVSWSPKKEGKYRISVYVPESGATADQVVYTLSPSASVNSDVSLKPIRHTVENHGTWVSLVSADGSMDQFPLKKDGKLKLVLGNSREAIEAGNNTANNGTKLIAIDAVKFESVDSSTSTEISCLAAKALRFSWFGNALLSLCKEGIHIPSKNRLFDSDGKAQRGDFVRMVVEAIGARCSEVDENAEPSKQIYNCTQAKDFNDVQSSDEVPTAEFTAIRVASAANWIGGYAGTMNFGPTNNLTRGEAAKIVAISLGICDGESCAGPVSKYFLDKHLKRELANDASEPTPFYRDYVLAAASSGLVNGHAAGRDCNGGDSGETGSFFCPDDHLNNAEMVQLVSNLKDRLEEKARSDAAGQ